MGEELLRCPHCDSDRLEVYRFMQVARTDHRYVWCHGCDAHGPIGDGAAHAVELWNWRRAARAPGPGVSRLLTAAKEALDWLHSLEPSSTKPYGLMAELGKSITAAEHDAASKPGRVEPPGVDEINPKPNQVDRRM